MAPVMEAETARLRRNCKLWADAVRMAEWVRAREAADADRYEAQLRKQISELTADRDGSR
ncbi:hypothetical protein ABZV31_36205 [Streptomyces sp. NPDC005202]|uniref:hypothetical protein n=1 Tax=Streptomyces sp. NPDC005202 TaxID=3157021 RepID=UPI0033A74E0D